MKQALHIFAKDARHLWPQITVALILVAVHAVLDILQSPMQLPETQRLDELEGLASFLLTLAWWSLIAAAIYEEVLPGDRQFWVTRPYSWKYLLAAKVLFIAAFVNIPLLISDCFILAAQGLPVLSNLPDLVLRQGPVSCWLILPSFALATLTSGMGQFVLAWLVVITGIITESFVEHSVITNSALEVSVAGTWVLAAIMLAIGGTIIWQYSKRRTLLARLMLAGFVYVAVPALSAIPGTGESRPEMRGHRVDVSSVRVAYDLTHVPSTDLKRFSLTTGPASVWLPLRVSGLPPETALVGHGELAIGALSGEGLPASQVERRGGDYFERTYLDPTKLQAIHQHHVNLRTTLHLTLITDRMTTKAPLWQKPIVVPGLGHCETDTDFQGTPQLVCRTGVRSPAAARVWVEYPGFHSEPMQWGQVTSDGNLLFGLSPVAKLVIPLADPLTPTSDIRPAANHSGAEIGFTVQRPLADFTREVDLTDVDLTPYLGAP